MGPGRSLKVLHRWSVCDVLVPQAYQWGWDHLPEREPLCRYHWQAAADWWEAPSWGACALQLSFADIWTRMFIDKHTVCSDPHNSIQIFTQHFAQQEIHIQFTVTLKDNLLKGNHETLMKSFICCEGGRGGLMVRKGICDWKVVGFNPWLPR